MEEKTEVLELKRQTLKDLEKLNRSGKKTITIVVDDELEQVLKSLEQELIQAFPGVRPRKSDLVRHAVLKAGKGELV